MRPSTITVWVCDNCGHYYASSTLGDLRRQWNEVHGVRTFRRSRCPTRTCAEQEIDRVPITVRLPHA